MRLVDSVTRKLYLGNIIIQNLFFSATEYSHVDQLVPTLIPTLTRQRHFVAFIYVLIYFSDEDML